jgi:hypothetical protein
MEKRLADFCEIEWQWMLDAACVELVSEATSVVAAQCQTVASRVEFFRLPRAVIEEATAFVQENAEACLLSREEVPTMPVADPWGTSRRRNLESRVCQLIDQLVGLTELHWGLPKEATAFSRYNATTVLLREVASKWEKGQRAYHQALHKCDTNANQADRLIQKTEVPTSRKRPLQKRGDTTEERLRRLLNTQDGVRSILAAGTVDGVASLIRRSHGSVAGSAAWKTEIKPLLERLKAERVYARLECEERRRDRHQTD